MTVAGLSALILIIAAIGLANVQAIPIMRRAMVKMPGLAAGTPPVRVALLSDIHLGNHGMRPGRLANIVDQVNAARPDLIVIAGDFVTGHDAEGIEARATGLTAPLSRLRAPLGVFAVLGNHDHWTSPTAIRSALEKAGIITLENQAERRGPLAIIGIGDRFSGHEDIARSIAAARRIGGAPIIVTHSPDIVPNLPPGFPLVLAGHTHCGQVVLPWLGPLITRAPRDHWKPLYMLRYRCGLVRDPGRLTVVTAGLGSGSAPIRLGAMPDWWLLTLHP
ncbi:metallophosphoesterase [Sphingomonas alpina]|uniref:Metallophosphoesterase n=1 Tax=Sphingomonas alpina TaxID=653931 RepID=A0A7H0LNM9_9SPHN|nr:metallophosphoesterase [Sphingomonas alpina]QNQ11282.1 metallophosphoesterase [Sphingomonas alpina]